MSWVKKFETSKVTSDTLNVTTNDVDSSGCDLIVVHTSNYVVQANGTLSDNKGNTWTALTPRDNGQYCRSSWFYSTGANLTSVGAGHHFIFADGTGGSGASYPVIEVSGWSGVGATPFDVQNNAGSSGGSSLASGSITPTSGDLVLTSLTENNSSTGTPSGTPTTPSGFTLLSSNPYTNGLNFGNHVAYVAGSSGSYNASWVYAQTSDGVVEIISFKGAGGGGTTDGTLASTPTGTCAFVGSSTASSTFASTPSTTCAWTGAMLKSSPWTGGQGFPNGVTNVFWLNCIAYFIVPFVSTPLADCEFTGASTASSAWASTPSTTCSFVNVSSGVFASTPSATCSFIGLVQDQGVFTSTPSASCSFTSIGYSIGTLAATPGASCAFVGERVTDLSNYLRRYLNDQSSMSVVGTAEDLDTSTEDDDTSYIRRYLNDKV